VLGIASLLGVLGFFLLQVAAVRQQQLAQLECGRRTKHLAAKPIADQGRNVAGMVQVRVRQQHRVDSLRWYRKFRAVALTQ